MRPLGSISQVDQPLQPIVHRGQISTFAVLFQSS